MTNCCLSCCAVAKISIASRWEHFDEPSLVIVVPHQSSTEGALQHEASVTAHTFLQVQAFEILVESQGTNISGEDQCWFADAGTLAQFRRVMHRVCRALLRDLCAAPDSAQAAIETTMAVILELWRGSFFFSLCRGRAALLSVCAYTQSEGCSYVIVDLGLLDLYMI